MAGPSSSDVPDRYDVVFSLNDGTTYGFLYADSVESNLPFRTHKALYSYSPTFLERQNVSNTYGDNFQDFFLTGTQADFSEGEQQQFFRVNDADSVRRYWAGQSIDPVTTPGHVYCAYQTQSITASASIKSFTPSAKNAGQFWLADATNIYSLSAAGSLSAAAAHGLTGSGFCMCTDGNYIYISDGTNGVKSLTEDGLTYASFSSTSATTMVVNDNILYGYSNGVLNSYSTGGVATSQFTWKDAKGGAQTSPTVGLTAYGGSVFILKSNGYTPSAELWQYDGTGCKIVATLPADFTFSSMCVSAGIIFIGGNSRIEPSDSGNANTYRPTVYYYSGGSLGKLWQSKYLTPAAGSIGLTTWGNGVLIADVAKGSVLAYDLALSGTHSVFQFSSSSAALATGGSSNCLLVNGTSLILYPSSSRVYQSGLLQTSQYDFDNTLSKVFRAIKVDADIPANTSIDLAYQVDGAGGTYTSLQTGAASGTEYTLPANTTGHSISVQVKLNSATGSATPILKRVYVRAAPTLQQFRRREYLFDLSSGTRDEIGKTSRRTRDGFVYPKDAITGCNDLAKIATQTIPFTVYDRFVTGGMTVLADLQQNQAGYDGFAIYEVEPNVYIGRINLREV